MTLRALARPAIAALAFVACLQNPAPGGSSGPDAGSPEADAAPPAEDGSSSGPDASTSMTDGGQPGGPVTLYANAWYDAQHPLAGVHVYAADSAGHIVSQADTDAMGSVTLDVPAGGSLSAFSLSAELYSYFDLTAGDVVRQFFADTTAPPPPPPPPQNQAMGTVTVSANHPATNATGYVVYLSCGGETAGPGLPLQVTGYKGCYGSSKFDVLVMAKKKGSDGSLSVDNLTYAFIPDVAFTPGQPANLSFDWSSIPLVHASPAFTGIPAGAAGVSISAGGSKSNLDAVDVQPLVSQQTPSSTATLGWDLPGNVFETFEIDATMGFVANTPQGPVVSKRFRRRFWTQGPTPPSPVVDASSLAFVTGSVAVDEVAHLHATWTLEAGPRGDAITASTGWLTNGQRTAWTLFASPVTDHRVVTMPDLPATFDKTYAPKPWSIFSKGSVELQHIDEDALTGYSDYVGKLPGNRQGTTTTNY